MPLEKGPWTSFEDKSREDYGKEFYSREYPSNEQLMVGYLSRIAKGVEKLITLIDPEEIKKTEEKQKQKVVRDYYNETWDRVAKLFLSQIPRTKKTSKVRCAIDSLKCILARYICKTYIGRKATKVTEETKIQIEEILSSFNIITFDWSNITNGIVSVNRVKEYILSHTQRPEGD